MTERPSNRRLPAVGDRDDAQPADQALGGLTAPLAKAITRGAGGSRPPPGVSARLRAWWLFAAAWPCIAYVLPLIDSGPEGMLCVMLCVEDVRMLRSSERAAHGCTNPPQQLDHPCTHTKLHFFSFCSHPGASRFSTTGLLACVAGHAAAYVLVETSISHAVVKRAVGSDADSVSSTGCVARSTIDSPADIEGVP